MLICFIDVSCTSQGLHNNKKKYSCNSYYSLTHASVKLFPSCQLFRTYWSRNLCESSGRIVLLLQHAQEIMLWKHDKSNKRCQLLSRLQICGYISSVPLQISTSSFSSLCLLTDSLGDATGEEFCVDFGQFNKCGWHVWDELCKNI